MASVVGSPSHWNGVEVRLTRFVFVTHCLAHSTSAWMSPMKKMEVNSSLSFWRAVEAMGDVKRMMKGRRMADMIDWSDFILGGLRRIFLGTVVYVVVRCCTVHVDVSVRH